MNTNTIAPPDLGKLNELAKVHALSYASPHHFTMSVSGLREVVAAIAALEAEPQDGDVEQALNRMDALLDPSLNLLAVSEDSITLQGCRADMLTIRRALRMAPAAREPWSHAQLREVLEARAAAAPQAKEQTA